LKEVAAATAFLQAKLKAVFPTTLVQAGPVPPTLAASKAIVYELLSAVDVNQNGDARVYQRQQWKAVVVAEGTTIAPLVDDGGLIDTALGGQRGSNAYGTIHYCQRRQSLSLPLRDQDTGRSLIQFGGIYEILVSAS
jgi:hypothetical protein